MVPLKCEELKGNIQLNDLGEIKKRNIMFYKRIWITYISYELIWAIHVILIILKNSSNVKESEYNIQYKRTWMLHLKKKIWIV